VSSRRYSAREASRALGLSAETLRRRGRGGNLGARRERAGWTYSAREVHLLRRIGAAWMTSSQVARVLKRSTKTVNAWADVGLLVFRRGPGQWRWFARASVIEMARRLGGRRRLRRADRAHLLSKRSAGGSAVVPGRARLGRGSNEEEGE
jgi:DNA-binding transcriptional MerR regulator